MLEKLTIYLILLATIYTASEGVDYSYPISCKKCLLEVSCFSPRDDYVNVPGIGNYKLHTMATDWNTARITCNREGAYLAVPNSIAEAKAIGTILADDGGTISGTSNSDYAFIGFHDQFKEGEYMTIFSQALSNAGYDRFAFGEPNNGGGAENCGSITKANQLNDINCTDKYAFICELVACDFCRSL